MAAFARGPPEVFCYFTTNRPAAQPFFVPRAGFLCFFSPFFCEKGHRAPPPRAFAPPAGGASIPFAGKYGVEGGGDVVDPVREHLEHVEAHGQLLPRLHQKVAGDVGIAALLVPLDRLRRAAVGVRKAGLDLAKDDGVAVLRDDVRLAEGGAVVGL